MERKNGQDVRLEDVAHAAGISRQAVYLHFRTRAELLVATVRFVDEENGVEERVRAFASAVDGVQALEVFMEWWGGYIPEIYGLAKALLAARETDQAAAAAWDDRMGALRNGCRSIIRCLKRDEMLALDWDLEQAADLLWSMISVSVWENLTVECGWSNRQYISRMQAVLKQTFVRKA